MEKSGDISIATANCIMTTVNKVAQKEQEGSLVTAAVRSRKQVDIQNDPKSFQQKLKKT